VKRLESSFYAFRKTLERFIESYQRFIDMYDSGVMYIGKNKNIYEMLDNGEDEKLLYLIEQGELLKFHSNEFCVSLIRDLRNDLAQLRTWQSLWKQIKGDPKLTEFKISLKNNPIIKGKKVIVFTESTETAEYLYKNLSDLYGDRVIQYSSKSSASIKSEIEDSFNPKYQGSNNDKYDLLITTDVLAEGVNLHRANVLINYDLPWNPTRIMQRVGRINRVGTAFDRIYVYNFFPTAQSSRQLPLEVRILEKLQAFHDTLGEDIKYLSDEEQVSPKKLFDDLNSNLDTEEESTNPELAYLTLIRQIRDDQPELFETIKRLPRKCKAGKKHIDITKPKTISFIRKGALKTFFACDGGTANQMTFMDAIGFIESSPEDKQITVGSDYYRHLATNDNAFDDMVIADELASTEKSMVTGNDAKVIKLLKAIKSEKRLTDIQEDTLELLIKRWGNGEMPSKISKDVLRKSAVTTDVLELYYDIVNLIPQTYLDEQPSGKSLVEGEKQVILSCYLKSEESK
jgi:superfamily II DNA/RNA helicase